MQLFQWANRYRSRSWCSCQKPPAHKMHFYSSRSSSSCCQWTLNLTSCSGRLRRTRSFGYFPNGIVCFICSIQHTEPAQCVAALTLFTRLSVSQLPYNVKYTCKSYKTDDMFALFFLPFALQRQGDKSMSDSYFRTHEIIAHPTVPLCNQSLVFPLLNIGLI